jgi:hypothetical protein
MLRPTNNDWFHIKTMQEDREDNEAKCWLEWASKLQRRAMYDRSSQFIRATKEADHDFAAFGQCVLSAEFDLNENALLYRSWHLRDVSWCEGYNGIITDVYRKWKPSVRELSRYFKGNISSKAKELMEQNPYAEIDVIHAVVLADHYEYPDAPNIKNKAKYVSVYFEQDTGHINQEIGTHNQCYIIPRWQTVSGSQYAYSPATVAALPDARLIQAMTLVLLEAGQKAVDPPMIAPSDTIRSDINLLAGGITIYDAQYDESTGDVLRPLGIDSRGIPLGMEMRNDAKEMIAEAFFLNKLNMPTAGGPDMTAYEVGQRVQEYIRNALPLFEPMEMDYNGALCDVTFDILLRAGAFGNTADMPESLSGQEIQFRFESPLQESVGKQKGQIFQNASGLLAQAAALDPTSVKMMDVRAALRDTLDGIGTPAKWIRDEKAMLAEDQAAAQAAQTQQMIGLMQAGGDAAKSIGEGGQAMNAMQVGAA